jgi:hypothetical protein
MRIATCVVTLLLVPALQAQRVLYNPKQDQTAQDAVAAAKDIAAGTLFNTMLRNVDGQSRQEADTTLAYLKEQMRSKLAAASVWNAADDKRDSVKAGTLIHDAKCKSLRCQLEVIQRRLNETLPAPTQAEVDKKVNEIAVKKDELSKAVEQLKARAEATKDPVAIQILSHLGDAKDALAYADQIKTLIGNAALGKALDEVSSGLDQAILLYNTVKGIWDGYKAVQVDPTSLRPAREVTELRLLGLEEEHIKRLSRIRANEQLETGAALQGIGEALGSLQRAQVWESTDSIEDTLRLAAMGDPKRNPPLTPDSKRVRDLLDTLFQSAAVLATQDAAKRLAANRISDEERRYSILRSAVNSSTYDETIQAAVQRLAVYYKGGIKPADLAQLIFFVTNSIAVPTIAAK